MENREVKRRVLRKHTVMLGGQKGKKNKNHVNIMEKTVVETEDGTMPLPGKEHSTGAELVGWRIAGSKKKEIKGRKEQHSHNGNKSHARTPIKNNKHRRCERYRRNPFTRAGTQERERNLGPSGGKREIIFLVDVQGGGKKGGRDR